MKNITVESVGDPGFVPIHVEFDIESADELFELWHRLDIAPSKVARVSNDRVCPRPQIRLWDLWERIDNIRKERGL